MKNKTPWLFGDPEPKKVQSTRIIFENEKQLGDFLAWKFKRVIDIEDLDGVRMYKVFVNELWHPMPLDKIVAFYKFLESHGMPYYHPHLIEINLKLFEMAYNKYVKEREQDNE